jgi:hypothetical protein
MSRIRTIAINSYIRYDSFSISKIDILNYYFVVHELRPGDIHYVGAIGDSLTVSIWKEKSNIN